MGMFIKNLKMLTFAILSLYLLILSQYQITYSNVDRSGQDTRLSAIIAETPANENKNISDSTSLSWSEPVLISESMPMSSSSQPQLSIDGSGNAVVAWSSFMEESYAIFYSTKPKEGHWSAPKKVFECSEEINFLNFKLNKRGDAVLAWLQIVDENEEKRVVKIMRRPFGGEWSKPSILSNAANVVNLIAVQDENGNALAVWDLEIDSTITIQSSYAPNGGVWSAPKMISSTGVLASVASISIDKNGNGIVLWEQFDEKTSEFAVVGSTFTTEISQKTSQLRWSKPEYISEPTGNLNGLAKVVIDDSGNSIAAWSEYDASYDILKVSRKPYKGSWSPPQTVLKRSGFISNTYDLYVNTDEKAIIAWTETTQNNGFETQIKVSRISSEGLLSDPITLEGIYFVISEVHAKLDSAGNALVVWCEYSHIKFDERLQLFSEYITKNGTSKTQQEITKANGMSSSPSFCFDSLGHAVMVWIEFNPEIGEFYIVGSTLSPRE